MNNAMSIVQIDFGHRSVDVTIEDLRRWQHDNSEASIVDALAKLRLKDKPATRDFVRGLVADIAAQTQGVTKQPCMICGSMTYGSDVGEDLCEPCFELGGIDNGINDSGRTEIDADEMADIRGYLDQIEAAGGSALKSLMTCDYIRNVGVNIKS